MKYRFLLHFISHTYVIVDITNVELSNQSRHGNTQMAPAFRFTSWKEAKAFLLAKRATTETVDSTNAQLRSMSLAVATILAV
jgi:hypothetical protein